MRFTFQTLLADNFEVEIQVHNDEEFDVVDLATGKDITDDLTEEQYHTATEEIGVEGSRWDQALYDAHVNSKILARKEGEL